MPRRRYADLHIKVTSGGDAPELLIKMAKHLGFSLIALSLDEPYELNRLGTVKGAGKDFGVDIALRLDLKPSSPKELKKCLGKFRRSVEIMAVYCYNVAVARTAARDRRVDITFYDPENILSILDERQVNLLLESGHCVEVNLSDLLGISPEKQAKALWHYGLALKKVKKKGIPIIISSGATKIVDMRAPRELSALASIILEDEEYAREMVSSVPLRLVQANREKLSQSFILPGVKVVKEW
ncbi:MAG: RNase P subunit p30 family protein [Candidatus Nezhaarchaeales archaeon]